MQNMIGSHKKAASANTSFSRCLVPLLDALEWQGSPERLAEAMPVDLQNMTQIDFLNTLANLRFESTVRKQRLHQIEPRRLPCLFIKANGAVNVLIKPADEGFLVYDGINGTYARLPIRMQKGTAIYFQSLKAKSGDLLNPQKNWFRRIVNKFYKVIIIGILLTFILSLFSFISPLFVMTIYNQTSASGGATALRYLGIGILIFIFGDLGFRFLRSHLFNYFSVRMGQIVGIEVMRRLLYLPPELTESASTGSQISRIKDFDSVQEFFSGSMVLSLFDLPFISLLILGMVFIGGSIAFVPIVAVLLFIVSGLMIRPFMQQAIEESAVSGSKRHEYLIDLISNFDAIKLSGATDLWLHRFREISASAAMDSFKLARINTLINTTSQFIVALTGLGTITVGIFKVIAGEMSSGALMASVMIIWRILAPLRTGFSVVTQVGRVKKSIEQIDRLMSLKLENKTETSLEVQKQLKGTVRFSQVSFRYSADSQPALLGLSFEVNPGEILVVRGHDGSGKSAILKLLLALYRPQAGQITIGNINIRQLDPVFLRRALSYSPQNYDIFTGTIKEYLYLASPLATDDELSSAVEKVGILEQIQNLNDGFDTYIDQQSQGLFSKSFIKRLGLAQFFLRSSPFLLLDEPDQNLKEGQLSSIMKQLLKLGSANIVIIVSNNRKLLEYADKILVMENGRMNLYGPASSVLEKLKAQDPAWSEN